MTESELWRRLEAEVKDREWDKAATTATLFAERGWGPSCLRWWVTEGRRYFDISPTEGSWRFSVIGLGLASSPRETLESALWQVQFTTEAIGSVVRRYQ